MPPVTFPLIGLGRDWAGLRWLSGWGGSVGEAPSDVTLAHGTTVHPAPRVPWMMVTTFDRGRVDALAGRSGDLDSALAHRGMLWLVNQVAPDELSGAARDRYWRNAVILTDRHARRCRRWATADWTIGRKQHIGRFTRFAGAWTGFIADDSGPLIVVNATGMLPHRLRFAEVKDSTAYHFDLSRALPGDAVRRSTVAALGTAADADHGYPLRADQRRLSGPIISTDPAEKSRANICAAPGCSRVARQQIQTIDTSFRAFGHLWKHGESLAVCERHTSKVPQLTGRRHLVMTHTSSRTRA